MRALTAGVAAAFLVLATTMPSWAVNRVAVSVPPHAVSVTVVVLGTSNSTGQVTSSTTTSYCPAGSTITITVPANNATTTYGTAASFFDGNGSVISTFSYVDTSDGGSGLGGSGGKQPPAQGGG